MDTFEKILSENHLNLTGPRKSIFNLLLSADIPMSVATITYELRTIDRATVYRTFETFEDIGVTKRIWLGNRIKYELGEQFKDHHHHLVCDECGGVTKIESKDLERTINRLAKKSGYRHSHHHLEIFGHCDKH